MLLLKTGTKINQPAEWHAVSGNRAEKPNIMENFVFHIDSFSAQGFTPEGVYFKNKTNSPLRVMC